jgi:hypothetical protein
MGRGSCFYRKPGTPEKGPPGSVLLEKRPPEIVLPEKRPPPRLPIPHVPTTYSGFLSCIRGIIYKISTVVIKQGKK